MTTTQDIRDLFAERSPIVVCVTGIGRDAGLSEQESMDKSHSSDTTPNMFETQLSDTVSTEGSEPHHTPGREGEVTPPHHTPGREAEVTPGLDTPGLEENVMGEGQGGIPTLGDNPCHTPDDVIKTSPNQRAGSDHVTVLPSEDGEGRALHNYMRSMQSGSIHGENEEAEIEGKI